MKSFTGKPCSAGSRILCVGKESVVLMGDLSTKRIDCVQIGDVVATYSVDSHFVSRAVVDKVGVSVHEDVRRVVFENGADLVCTADHPIWVMGKGWCAVSAEIAFENYGVRCSTMALGDFCIRCIESAPAVSRIVSIDVLPGFHEMYVISGGDSHCFFANGILVHDENVAMLSESELECCRSQSICTIA